MNRAPTTYRQSSQAIPARAAATNTQSHHSIGFHSSVASVGVASWEPYRSYARPRRGLPLPQTAVQLVSHPTVKIGSDQSPANCLGKMPGSVCTLRPERPKAVATNTSRRKRHRVGNRPAFSFDSFCAETTGGLGFARSWKVRTPNGGATFNEQDGSLRQSRPSNSSRGGQMAHSEMVLRPQGVVREPKSRPRSRIPSGHRRCNLTGPREAFDESRRRECKTLIRSGERGALVTMFCRVVGAE